MTRKGANPLSRPNVAGGSADGIIVADAYGSIRFLNKECAALLSCSPGAVYGRPCWEVSRLRTPQGVPFCGPDCAVQREIRDGAEPAPRRLVYPSPAGPPVGLDFWTVPIPPPCAGRCALLHVLAPVRVRTGGRSAKPPGSSRPPPPAANGTGAQSGDSADKLELLSRREREVLQLLAGGHSTRDIAQRLFISATTVYNHVQNILRKLQAHRRLEAVSLWFQTRD